MMMINCDENFSLFSAAVIFFVTFLHQDKKVNGGQQYINQ